MRVQGKKGLILYIAGRANQIATDEKLLDITHESNEYSDDLIETIN